MKLSAQPQRYPPAAIANMRATCHDTKDIPVNAMPAYCECYIELMQKTVPWNDFLLLESAISAKGPGDLDDEEKVILGKGLQVMSYCSQKVTR
jgi:hypothetical protein